MRSSRRRGRGRTWAARAAGASALTAALAGGRARAGGFEVGDNGTRGLGRGGAYVVGVQDLSALHFNPGALARLDGTHLLYNHNLVFHETTFARATLDPAWGAAGGTSFPMTRNRTNLFARGGFLAAGSDFGLRNWFFAGGVYGPSAVGKLDYADYGPQSFMLTDLDITLLYYSLAAAWQIPRKFGVGVTLQYADLARMDYGMVADATVTNLLSPVPDATSQQLVTKLHLRDRTGFSALVGLWGRPHRRVELGLGGRVVPVLLHPKGTVSTDKPTLITDDLRVDMPLTFPVHLRAGIRYLHPLRGSADLDRFDLELDVGWENWSAIQRYDLHFAGTISGQEVQDFAIDKRWRDTLSVRLGGDVNLADHHLRLRSGAMFETGAARPAYAHLDFPSFTRGGPSVGLSAGGAGVWITAAYLHVFQAPQVPSERSGKTFQQRPLRPCPAQCEQGASGVVANAGTIRSHFDFLSLGLDINFAELVKSARAARTARAASARPRSPPATAPTPPPRPRR